MTKLSESQWAILRLFSDGALHNPLAWLVLDDDDSIVASLRGMWDTAWLVARGLAEVYEDDGTDMWVRITAEGRRTLAEREYSHGP